MPLPAARPEVAGERVDGATKCLPENGRKMVEHARNGGKMLENRMPEIGDTCLEMGERWWNCGGKMLGNHLVKHDLFGKMVKAPRELEPWRIGSQRCPSIHPAVAAKFGKALKMDENGAFIFVYMILMGM